MMNGTSLDDYETGDEIRSALGIRVMRDDVGISMRSG